MNILSLFNGPRVRLGGFIITGVGALLLHNHRGALAGYLAGLAVALLSTYFPAAFKWLANFADPQYWPAFVGLGISILIAAHTGGWVGLLLCIGPLTSLDGMYFEQNY